MVLRLYKNEKGLAKMTHDMIDGSLVKNDSQHTKLIEQKFQVVDLVTAQRARQ
jgi:hypothetical protein